MSTGYPFSTLSGNNVLDQVLSPKIVGSPLTGYGVKMDLGNIDTMYSNQIGTTAHRVSDIYGVTLHYQYLDPPITGGGGGSGVTGPVGPTGPAGIRGNTGIGIVGPTGYSQQVTVDQTIHTNTLLPFVIDLNNVTPRINPDVHLSFGIPPGPRGPPGPPGNGTQIIQGPRGNVLFFDGATGVTSSSAMNFSNQTLTVANEVVSAGAGNGQIRLCTTSAASFIQSGPFSNPNQGNVLSVGRLASGQDKSVIQTNTQSYQVAIGKGNTPTGNPNDQTLDVYGRTLLHVDAGANSSGGLTAGSPIHVVSGTTVATALTSGSYRVYVWGEGGQGPNALAGGEIEFDYVVPSTGSNLSYSLTGAGGFNGSGFTGGNAVTLTLDGIQLWAYGGGGGSTLTNGGAGQTPQGGSIVTDTGSIGSFFQISGGGSSFTFAGAKLQRSPATSAYTVNFPTGTSFTFPKIIPSQTGFTQIPMHSGDIIQINLNGGIAAVPSGPQLVGAPGTTGSQELFSITTELTNTPIIVPQSSTPHPEYGIPTNGTGNIIIPNIEVTGAGIQLYTLPSDPNLIPTSSIVSGTSSASFLGNGSISFASTNANEINGQIITLSSPMAVTFINASLNAEDITATITQSFIIGFHSYGTTSFAGDGTAGHGGVAINGGGGGGGYLGGGGGNQNIGGIGSSLAVNGIINGTNNSISPSPIPYQNQWSTTYGSPGLAGGWIVIEKRVSNNLALGVTGDVLITGNETIGGILTSQASYSGGYIGTSGTPAGLPRGAIVGSSGITIQGGTIATSVLTTTETPGGTWQLNLSNGLNVTQQLSGAAAIFSGLLTANGGISLGSFAQPQGALTPAGGGQYSMTISGWRIIWGYEQNWTQSNSNSFRTVSFSRPFSGSPVVLLSPVCTANSGPPIHMNSFYVDTASNQLTTGQFCIASPDIPVSIVFSIAWIAIGQA